MGLIEESAVNLIKSLEDRLASTETTGRYGRGRRRREKRRKEEGMEKKICLCEDGLRD
jgi:hypothetical protein